MSERSRTSNDEINKENEENELAEKAIIDALNLDEEKYKIIENYDPIRYKNLDSFTGDINKETAKNYDIDYDEVKNMKISEFRKAVRDNDIERFKNINTDYRPIQTLKRGINKKIAEKYNVPWSIAKNYKKKENFLNYLKEKRKVETINEYANQINTVHESKDKAGNKILYLQYNYLHDNKKTFSEKIKQLMGNFGTTNVNVSLMANPTDVTDYDAKIYKKHFRDKRTTTIDELIKFFTTEIEVIYDFYYNYEYAYIIIAPVEISYNKKKLKMGTPTSKHVFNCIFNMINIINGKGEEYKKKYNNITDKDYKPSIEELREFANNEKINMKFYTPINEILNIPLIELKRKKPVLSINVVIHDEHARFKHDIIDGIKKIHYYEFDKTINKFKHDAVFEDCNILFIRPGFYDGVPDIKFYDTKDKCLSLLKSFRPSEVTNNPLDDTNPEYFNCFSVSSLLFRKWCLENNFKPIKNNFINDILKKACKTCGFFRYEDFEEDNYNKYLEIDHNRSYSISTNKKNSFYAGYPTNSMELYNYNEGDDLTNVIFFYVSLIEYPRNYTFLPVQYECLSAPMYNFMLSIGCKITIDSVIYGELKDITDQPTVPNPKECKFMQNMHIGKLITGGIDQLQTKKYYAPNKLERLAAIDQLNKHNIPYTIDPCNENYIYFKIPINTQMYHIYAYVVQYSQIAIMQMMIKLQDMGHKILAGNCDALMIKEDLNLPDLTGFKFMHGTQLDHEKKQLYRYYEPKSKLIKFEHIIKNDPLNTVNRPPIIGNKLIISGPAGCGKGYNYIRNSDSRYTMIVSPTHKRRRENAEYNTNSQTIQMLTKRININQANYNIKKLIIDEYTQSDNRTINDIINWANQRDINIVMLGDHCQLFNDITNNKIDLNNLIETSNFKLIHFERTNVSRQECHIFAKWLDSLRWNINEEPDYKRLAAKVCVYFGHENKEKYKKLMAKTPDDYIYVSEKHAELYNYNKLLNKKSKNVFIDCINVKGNKQNKGKIEKIHINDKNIKWDKMKMNDIKTHVYEPFTTSTIYSLQGDTIREKKIGIDIKGINSVNSLYTAITRTVKKSQIVILL